MRMYSEQISSQFFSMPDKWYNTNYPTDDLKPYVRLMPQNLTMQDEKFSNSFSKLGLQMRCCSCASVVLVDLWKCTADVAPSVLELLINLGIHANIYCKNNRVQLKMNEIQMSIDRHRPSHERIQITENNQMKIEHWKPYTRPWTRLRKNNTEAQRKTERKKNTGDQRAEGKERQQMRQNDQSK